MPEAEPGRARDEAARLLNVSPRSVEYAGKVYRDAVPELARAMETGQVKVSAAALVADLPHLEQAKLVAEGPKAVRAKASEIRRRNRSPEPATGPAPDPAAEPPAEPPPPSSELGPPDPSAILAPPRDVEPEPAAVAADMLLSLERQMADFVARCDTLPEEDVEPIRKAFRKCVNSYARALAAPDAASGRVSPNRSLAPDQARKPLAGQMDLLGAPPRPPRRRRGPGAARG